MAYPSNAAGKPVPVRVLIVEDEALIALSLSDLLEDEGFEVTLASDGAKALIEARRLGSSLGALLTDLNMPYMSGEVLIHTLHTEQPELPVVVMTGSAPFGGLEELRRQSGGHGPLNLLHKPIDYAMLLNTLRQATASK
jgi:CheY-like chemotaxis protein